MVFIGIDPYPFFTRMGITRKSHGEPATSARLRPAAPVPGPPEPAPRHCEWPQLETPGIDPTKIDQNDAFMVIKNDHLMGFHDKLLVIS